MARKLPHAFYARDTLVVAPALLGKILVRNYRGRRLAGRIAEVEAYLGPSDVASHARHGAASKAAPMFGKPGHAYVYFTYGMHHCLNCVTEPVGSGTGILIRAVEPIEGVATMRRLRERQSPAVAKMADTQLTNGPGKVCWALDINIGLNREDLTGDRLWIEEAPTVPRTSIATSSRVGIRQGREHPWRFYLKDSSFVSSHPRY